MNMPGFTAETSLYRTAGRYHAIADPANGLVAGRRVLPQLPIGFCMADCDDQYEWGTLDNSVCKFNCMDSGNGGAGGGGGGAGGGGATDAQICARCKSNCHRGPASKLKACLKNCDDVACSA